VQAIAIYLIFRLYSPTADLSKTF